MCFYLFFIFFIFPIIIFRCSVANCTIAGGNGALNPKTFIKFGIETSNNLSIMLYLIVTTMILLLPYIIVYSINDFSAFIYRFTCQNNFFFSFLFFRFSSEEVSAQNQVKASVQRKIRQSIADEVMSLFGWPFCRP